MKSSLHSQVMQHKRIKGDKRPEAALMAACIKDFNAKQTTKEPHVLRRARCCPQPLAADRSIQADAWHPLAEFPCPAFRCSGVPHQQTLASRFLRAAGQTCNPPANTCSVVLVEGEAHGLVGSRHREIHQGAQGPESHWKEPQREEQGAILRKEPDDEMVRHAACFFRPGCRSFRPL